MQAVFQSLDLSLGGNQSLVLSRAATAAILVETGSVWVTRAGDRRDHVLSQGQRLTVDNEGAVVLMALGGARVGVAAARPARGAVTRFLRGLHALYLRAMRRLANRPAPHVCESLRAGPRKEAFPHTAAFG
jgi:hypothetical protein